MIVKVQNVIRKKLRNLCKNVFFFFLSFVKTAKLNLVYYRCTFNERFIIYFLPSLSNLSSIGKINGLQSNVAWFLLPNVPPHRLFNLITISNYCWWWEHVLEQSILIFIKLYIIITTSRTLIFVIIKYHAIWEHWWNSKSVNSMEITLPN